jgi:23S rRNA (cytosine1962-C5)-methyltransferase
MDGSMNTVKKIVLKKNEEGRLLAGHLWIFSNEIGTVQGAPGIGDTVEAYDAGGRYLGKGFYNPHSLIAFRLLTRGREEIDVAFFRTRIADALAFRQWCYPGLVSFRLVFGESDNLSGLIVDKYAGYLTVQFLSAGMEKNKEQVIAALTDLFSPAGIVGRNDSALRRLEGLEEKIEVLAGTVPERVEIEENGCRFQVDLAAGQKTGFYFDQRENRAALAKYCKGKKVIDCFCHTGAFGIEAAAAGAAEVVWVDSSAPALALARENAQLNGMADRFVSINADVMEFAAERKNIDKFDIIILDPPALIKSRKHFQAGYRAYRKLNTSAIESLHSGGILATSSCSHHLSPNDFRAVLEESAAKAGRQVRLLELRSQSRDHPVLLSMPETEYLKFAILEVI